MLENYKKSSLVLAMMARDFLTVLHDEQIPTISEYEERFNVSRGIIQDALNILQNDNCIKLLKRGVKGTFLIEKNSKKLFSYSDWNVIVGTMPTPVNPYLRSLATAIFTTLRKNDVPFSFSYIMGGEKRSSMLNLGAYDFCIVSENTALHFIKQYPNLEVALRLAPCIYSMEYAMYINKANVTGIENGMTVSIDPASFDQTQLSHKYATGKEVRFVENSAVVAPDLFNQKKVDVLITRSGPWFIPNDDVSVVPIVNEFPDMYPIILVNKNNYDIGKFLRYHLNMEKLFEIQKSVLADPTKELFA